MFRNTGRALHRRLLFTLLMISMLGSINISVAGSSIVRFISMPSDAAMTWAGLPVRN